MEQFICPSCGHTELEECQECVAVSIPVVFDEDTKEPYYGDEGVTPIGASAPEYMCSYCGKTLELSNGNKVRYFEDLKAWLKENQKEEN